MHLKIGESIMGIKEVIIESFSQGGWVGRSRSRPESLDERLRRGNSMIILS